MGADGVRDERPILLAVSTLPLWPDSDGHSLRVLNLLQVLSDDWRIVVVARRAESDGWQQQLTRLHAVEWVDIGSGYTYLPWHFEHRPLVEALASASARHRPAAALLWGGAESCIAGIEGFPRAVGDRVDSLLLTASREIRRAGGPGRTVEAIKRTLRYGAYERRLGSRLAAAVVVGEDDARMMRGITRLGGGLDVHVIPNGVNASSDPRHDLEAPVPTVVFSGTLDYPPNIDAVLYYAREVWPLVHAEMPTARLRIVGRRPVDEVLALGRIPGVDVVGAVDDMAVELRHAWVAVAPMRQGAGIKNKVLEAWAVGRPVVMTSTATNGLRVGVDSAACVGDTPEELKRATCRLLQDAGERQRVGGAALAMVRDQFSWVQSGRMLTELLRRVTR